MAKVKSKEMIYLQKVWREALRRGGLTISFPSQAGAVRARMQLYNAVKNQKSGADLSDPELLRAAEELEIVRIDELTIRMQLRGKSDMMQGLVAAMGGVGLEDVVDPAAQESQERLLKELDQFVGKPAATDDRLAADHKPNPFFDRNKE